MNAAFFFDVKLSRPTNFLVLAEFLNNLSNENSDDSNLCNRKNCFSDFFFTSNQLTFDSRFFRNPHCSFLLLFLFFIYLFIFWLLSVPDENGSQNQILKN